MRLKGHPEESEIALLGLLNATCKSVDDKLYPSNEINGLVGAMHGINPNDEIEAMLASQMLATHFASMKALRRLNHSDQVPQQNSNGNLAIKLMRTYAAQIEALHRYRGKRQQKMTVEHVHVHAGGQAIVGNVNHSKGGGVATKTEEQPYAKERPPHETDKSAHSQKERSTTQHLQTNHPQKNLEDAPKGNASTHATETGCSATPKQLTRTAETALPSQSALRRKDKAQQPVPIPRDA